MYKAKNRSLAIAGIKMDYITFGVGKRPLILIPGLSTSRIKGKALVMSYAYRIFAKNFQCYVFDRKDKITSGYSITDMAEELALAIRVLGLHKVDVVGVSQGGMIAQSLAISHPNLINRLVLGVTTAVANETVQATIGGWISLAKEKDSKQLLLDMTEKIYTDHYRKRHRFLLWLSSQFLKTKEWERFEILASSILDFDVRKKLSRISCPVFVIGGKQDKVVGENSSQDLADRLGAECYLYDNIGHSAYLEADDFNKRICQFLLV